MKGLVIYMIACCICLLTIKATAQYYFYNNKYYASDWTIDAGISGGLMNSLTDIGGCKGPGKSFIKDLNWKVTKPCFGIYAIGMYKDVVGLRIEFSSGSTRSADDLLKKSDPDLRSRYGRNLSFKSHINEMQLAAEIHPLFFKWYDEDKSPFWSPYLVTGICLFSFDPKAFLNGYWYELHPLRLEGQGFTQYASRTTYKLTQLNIPLGLGIKYEAGAWLYLRFEMIYRILFTDYLDDVSTTYIDAALF